MQVGHNTDTNFLLCLCNIYNIYTFTALSLTVIAHVIVQTSMCNLHALVVVSLPQLLCWEWLHPCYC